MKFALLSALIFGNLKPFGARGGANAKFQISDPLFEFGLFAALSASSIFANFLFGLLRGGLMAVERVARNVFLVRQPFQIVSAIVGPNFIPVMDIVR